MKVSKMAKLIEPSKGRKLFNLAAQYDDVINLTLGDPDIIPPISVRESGCNAIMNGKTRYSANAGLIELRKAYADFIKNNYEKVYSAEKQVIVTVGGMEGLYLGMLSALDYKDEAIVFSPYYTNYYQMIQMCGARPIVVPTYEKDAFVPNLKELENRITDKTRLIIINSPCNPTGAIYSKDLVEGIIRIAKKYDILLVADEVYSSLVYDGKAYFSVMQSCLDYENILVVDSCSKRYSMTGWRVGFATGPEDWIQTMVKLQENIAACAPLPSQYAAFNAFSQQPDMSYYLYEFQKRRDILCKKLLECDALSFTIPQGAFYLFINISRTGLKSMDFSVRLLEKKRVAVVPGIAYGEDFDNYIRIAFTSDVNVLIEAGNRIKAFCDELKEI